MSSIDISKTTLIRLNQQLRVERDEAKSQLAASQAELLEVKAATVQKDNELMVMRGELSKVRGELDEAKEAYFEASAIAKKWISASGSIPSRSPLAESSSSTNGVGSDPQDRKRDPTPSDIDIAKTEMFSAIEAQVKAQAERDHWRSLAEKMEYYAEHLKDCVKTFFEAGRPTKDGGYEVEIKGQWYQTRPVDKTPKCTCGFAEALDAFDAK